MENKKNSFAINAEQMEYERRKVLEQMSTKIDRKKLKKVLREDHGVCLSGEVYEMPVHLQPYFDGKYKAGDFPLAEKICKHHVCLPIYQLMTDDEVRYVLDSLRKTLSVI